MCEVPHPSSPAHYIYFLCLCFCFSRAVTVTTRNIPCWYLGTLAGWVGVTPRYNAEVVSVGPVDMYADEETQSYLRLRDGQPPPKTARVGDKEGEREREREERDRDRDRERVMGRSRSLPKLVGNAR